MPDIEEVKALIPDLAKLSDDQFTWVKQLVRSMALPYNSMRSPISDVFPDDRTTGLFFLYLVTHHVLSAEPFKKEKFEYAVERIMGIAGRAAARPKSRTHRGHDLTVDGESWSFKSEAHAGIKHDTIWISKWMELGKGKWKDSVSDLKRLCSTFVDHLEGYDRIFILRCLTPESPIDHHYEMLEIPKHLLKECQGGVFKMMRDSRQDPKPGYCRVSDKQGLIYELYFDGGTERKLQVKKLRRDVCHFHAEWKFKTPEPIAEA